jgi:hypothetical protein
MGWLIAILSIWNLVQAWQLLYLGSRIDELVEKTPQPWEEGEF